MKENEGKTEKEQSYGCIFCLTGQEREVVKNIERSCLEVRAIVACMEKYKSQNGKKTKVCSIIIPSYVFFQAPTSMHVFSEIPKDHMIKVLSTEDGAWQLYGEDERFVRWLFEYDGLLGFSKAYQEGTRVRIVSGPLKDMEGQIKRVDKHGRSGQVVLSFQGKKIPVWLGFEWIEENTKHGS